MRHQLILPFDKDALPAYYDEEPDPERDPLYPRQPVIIPAALHGSPFAIDEDHSRLPVLYDEEGYPVILFAAVPLKRKRRHGWSERNQRLFVAALARTASIGQAVKVVGLSRRSLYTLIAKPEAEQFAKAIDMALSFARDRLRTYALSRGLEEEQLVPVVRRGRVVRHELKRNDRLAVAALNAMDKHNDSFRGRTAQTRWRQAQEYAAMDAANRYPTKEEITREVAKFIAEKRLEREADPNWGPRVRAL
jgi:hypothetical protein